MSWIGQLKSRQETIERERGNAAKGHRWNQTHGHFSEDQPLYMGYLLYQLSPWMPWKIQFNLSFTPLSRQQVWLYMFFILSHEHNISGIP